MNKHLITALLSMFFLTVWMLVYKKSHDTSRKRKRITLWIGTHLPGNPKRNYYFIVLFLYLVPPILFSFWLPHFVGIKIGYVFVGTTGRHHFCISDYSELYCRRFFNHPCDEFVDSLYTRYRYSVSDRIGHVD